ncbi:MAG: MOSC domain-containing protein [Kineosporiaceae bacterium]
MTTPSAPSPQADQPPVEQMDLRSRRGRLSAVCVVHAIIPNPHESPDVTAIDKRPRAGRLAVGPLGLALDVQVDRNHHGGEEQALYAYADEDAAWWAGDLGRSVPAGLFGENLRTSGVDVSRAEIGERWRITPSDADGGGPVLAEVTSPRTPCTTFQRRMDQPHWVKRFTQAGMPGAYLRVLTPGTLGAGDTVEVIERPGHGVTVSDLLAGGIDAYLALLDAHEAGIVTLGPKVAGHARRRTWRVRQHQS